MKVKKICGKRGGRNFKEAIRPSLDSGRCPDGFEACHPISEETHDLNSTVLIETTTCVENGQ